MSEKENTNLYEVRKSVRFLALGDLKPIINFLEIENKQSNEEKYNLLWSFLSDFGGILTSTKKIFFYENNWSLKDFFKIKYRFLQNHTKYDFYDIKKKERIYTFRELKFIEEFLINYFESLKEIHKNLDLYQSTKKEKQNRYREIWFYLQKLSWRNISILKDLFEFLVKTNKVLTDQKIEEIKNLLPDFETKLIGLLKEFWPNNWLEIAKWSFNYYILNKSWKEYFDKEISKLKNKQKYSLSKDVFILKEKDKQDVYLNELFFENIWLRKNDLENMILEEAYNFLKDFKAKRKSAFSQFVGNGYTYEDVINKVPRLYKYKENWESKESLISVELFADIWKDNFVDFKKLTDEINNLWSKINDILQPLDKKRKDYEKEINKKKVEDRTDEENKFIDLSNQVQEKAKERWKFFNIPSGKIYTKNYKNLCEFYKSIALRLWQNKARILWYEKQKVDSEKLKFFAVIVEKWLLSTLKKNPSKLLEGFFLKI